MTAALDPRLPVLVGVGEVTRRPGEDGPTEPGALFAEAVRAAAADAGSERLLDRVTAVAAAPSAGWMDGDLGRRAGDLLGLDGVATLRSSMQGGNGPQLLVTEVAARIAAGRLDAAIVGGAEALSTVAALMKRGEAPDWPAADPERRPDDVFEADAAASTEAEVAAGMLAPIMAYPLIENALRAAGGDSQSAHLARIAGLWSRFSEVAASQPAAWAHTTYTADELATPSAANRQVTLPYTKLLNSNIQVDMGAALLLCSVATAEELGIARDRWVFVHAGARATDEWFLSHRRELHRSPAIRACGEALFAHAGAGPDALGPIDLYSCFPSAVQLAAGELGLSLDRPLTCTGGLTFFGGPGNNYATHGIAAVARQLREAEPGALGLATALGWYATKHALGLYGNTPPDQPFAALEPTPEPAAREVAAPEDTTATAETATLIYDREGAPQYGILFALRDDGRRAVARTANADTMAAVATDEFLGSPVSLRADATFGP